jgi:hypothetical protein
VDYFALRFLALSMMMSVSVENTRKEGTGGVYVKNVEWRLHLLR